jgi:pyrimidine 5'-nucleotidase
MAFTINTVFIDLDGCLITPKLTRSVPNKIASYAVKYLKYDVGSASVKCREEYRRNGTNLEGFLRQGYEIDADHYHQHIHGSLPYTYHVSDMPRMRHILQTIPADKYIFTNADKKHAETCLELGGLSDCFKGIACYETLQTLHQGPYTACKPKTVAMHLALQYAQADALTSLVFDDQTKNVHMAMDYGVRAVLVGEDDSTCAYYAHLPSLRSLETTLFSSYFM